MAIKLLRPELGSLIGPERFLREIEISGRLNHPHILPLFEAGDAGGLPYFVMPFIEGESLRDRLIREQQLPVPEALQITREVADALAYAHAKDIIHRDIKPENILLSQGHAVVADFGIARAMSAAGGPRLTETGMAIGTVDYMSPEQATGSGQVDARSDLYSLACVLYEMLAGGPPFFANTAQGVMARHLVDAVPPIRTVRSTVPVTVEAAILCALAKSKADRFATVTEFVEALDGRRASPSQPYPAALAPGAKLWRRLAIAGGTAAVLLLAYLLGRRPALNAGGGTGIPVASRVLDSNLVAVAPFDILDPARGSWKEGLAEILSVNLDGAGALRTVPLDGVLQRWEGRADRASAEKLGRDHGAQLVVFGRAMPAGGDSVRLSLTLLDVVTGQVGPEIEVRESGSRLDLIADSATARILDNLNQVRAVGAVRSGGLGSSSWPAKKAYLAGESFYRRQRWDSAEVYYRQAVGIDSTFALAWRKLGLSRLNHVMETDTLVQVYSRRAGVFNHGLSPRDSLLVTADSLYATGQSADPQTTVHHRRLHATLEEAIRRYPDDVEAWYQFGRARYYAPLPGMGLDSTLLAFQRAHALDSGFAEALSSFPVIQIGFRSDSLGVAVRYLRIAARGAVTDERDGLRFAADLVHDPGAGSRATQWAVRAKEGELTAAAENLMEWTDSAETGIGLARALVARRIDPPDTVVARERRRILEEALIRRGHLLEAAAMTPRGYWSGQYALFGGLPADSIPPRRVGRLPWWARRRDLRALQAQVDSLDAEARLGTGPGTATHRAWRAARPRAYLALAAGDTADALRRFALVVDSMCNGCSYSSTFEDIYTAAPVLMARGRYREAATWLDYFPMTVPYPVYEVLFVLWRGQAAEHLGQLTKAASAYRYVARAWAHADPPLQGYVSQAVAGLQRVGGGAVW